MCRGRSAGSFDPSRPLVSTFVSPVPQEIDNSERDYFKAQVASDAGTYIGRVVRPRVGAKPIFTISQRRSGPGGEFLGVVAAAIVSDEFSRFYAQIGRLPGSYSALLRNDGVFLARYPEAAQPDAQLNENSIIRQRIAAAPDRGRFDAVSQLDGIKRRIAYRKLAGYPVYVLAGVEEPAIWREWGVIALRQVAFGIPATAILFMVLLFAFRRTKSLYLEADRRQAAEQALRQSQKMEAIGQLTGGVAHDFNNLLMVVEGNLARLRREMTSDRALRAADAIQAASERGKALTGRLLAFSRQQPLDVRTINVAEHISGIRDMLTRSLPSIIDISLDLRCRICPADVDPGELELAMLNLAVNARRTSSRPGSPAAGRPFPPSAGAYSR